MTRLWPVALAFVAACAPVATKPDRVAVSSEPAGADVYVMGTRLGVTPASIPLGAIFPLTYSADQQHLYGRVALRKPGCAPATQTVSTHAVARGVHVKLDCGRATAIDLDARSDAAQQAESPAALPPGPEQRLRQIRDWLDKGLITDNEAANARRRILDAL